MSYSFAAEQLETGLYLAGADTTDTANEIKLVAVHADPADPTSPVVGYEGYVGGDATSDPAFTVSIDSGSGEVTVTLLEALEHRDDGGPEGSTTHDDSLNLNDVGLKVVQTVTDKDGDYDSATSANALSITFKDDGPDAHNDLDGLIIDQYGAGSTTGNVLLNDSMGSDGPIPSSVTSVKFAGVTYSVSAGGTQIQGEYGLLTVYSNGDYIYEYNDEAVRTPISIIPGDTSGATLTAFDANTPYLSGGDLDLNAIPDSTVEIHGGGGSNKQGFGVGSPGTIDLGDDLVVKLSEAVLGTFTFEIGQYNKNQSDLSDMNWKVFDAEGGLVDSGTFADIGGTQTANGTYTGAPITFDEPVSYVVFSMSDDSGQGYTVTNLYYEYLDYPTGIDDFVYSVMDGDGDTSSAHLFLTSDSFVEGDSSANELSGGAGDDIVIGYDGDDDLYGDIGDDILVGGGGHDDMTGGEGRDTFLYSNSDLDSGQDQILDFQYGVDGDEIDLSDLFEGKNPQELVDNGHITIDDSDVDLGILHVNVDQDGVPGGSDFVNIELHLDSGVLDSGSDVVDTILNNNIKTEIP